MHAYQSMHMPTHTHRYVDPSVDCDSAEYTVMFPVALILVALYPIGIPCYFAFMLWKARDDIAYIRHEELLLYACQR